jgi:trans-feruloyl-CoA hydratase/vanillin synthase
MADPAGEVSRQMTHARLMIRSYDSNKENYNAKKKSYTCVLVETDDEGITRITFNRPEKRNAMSPTLHVEMEEILYGLETDEETKVIVLTGAGNS